MSVSLTVRPDRPHIAKFAHGSVTADWTSDSSTGLAIGVNYNFYVTDIVVASQSDLTADTSNVPVWASIQRETAASGDVEVVAFTLGLPNNPSCSLNTPVLLKVNETYHTTLKLGGSTAATCDVYLIGFDY